MNYYTLPDGPRLAWWTWIVGFWGLVAVWLVGQMVFGAGIFIAGGIADPEAMNQLMDASLAASAEGSDFTNLLAMGGSGVALLSLLIWLFGGGENWAKWTALAGSVAGLAGFGLLLGNNAEMAEANAIMMRMVAATPAAYMFMLLTFAAAIAGAWIVWKVLHALPLQRLHTAVGRFRWSRAIWSFLLMWGVLALYALYAALFTDNPPVNVFDPGKFLGFAVVSILLLPVQSAAEEIAVRGYMNIGLIQILKNKWFVFVLTSAAFMALHLANPEAVEGGKQGNLAIVMSGYFFFGFAACLMVLIDDGLESAIGVHAANNTFAAIFVNYENSVLPTPSIWQVRPDATGDALSTILILSIVLGLLWITRPGRRGAPA